MIIKINAYLILNGYFEQKKMYKNLYGTAVKIIGNAGVKNT